MSTPKNPTPYQEAVQAARTRINGAWSYANGTRDAASIQVNAVQANLAVAESILALAEALRPAPLEVKVNVATDAIREAAEAAIRDYTPGPAA